MADYNHDKVNQWTAAIVEQSLTHLVKLGKTYKYIGKNLCIQFEFIKIISDNVPMLHE